MIKKIVFRNLFKDKGSFTAIGGIRFYDIDEKLIESGNIITDTSTKGETTNFSVTVGASYSGSSDYNIIGALNTSKSQTGSCSTRCYWLTDNSSSQTITLQFKNIVNNISKIEFNPKPDTYTERNVGMFYIDVYDEKDNIIITYTVTPITTNNTVQSLDTPELLLTKTQIKFDVSKLDIYKNIYINKDNKVECDITPPDVAGDFTEIFTVNDNEKLGSGKMFKLPINNSMWKRIDKVDIK